MTETDPILDAIERRIVEANAEIASLIAARGALIANGAAAANNTAGTKIAATKSAAPKAAATKTATTKTATASAKIDPAATAETAVAATAAAANGNGKGADAGRRGRPAPRGRTRGKAPSVVPAGKLEVLLAGTDGLSAAALARRAGGSTAQVLTLLQELERSDKVGRTGRGRATRWRWITDEERIESRAAELEAQFKAVAR
jgi:hypothetical protein